MGQQPLGSVYENMEDPDRQVPTGSVGMTLAGSLHAGWLMK
jgi:hypothetical protein